MSEDTELVIRRMMQKFEHQISEMNSKAITEICGDVTESDFLNLARSVSILRAKYLKDVLRMARVDDEHLSIDMCLQTRKTRIAYEEGVESFDQLKHALQRGYFNLNGDCSEFCVSIAG